MRVLSHKIALTFYATVWQYNYGEVVRFYSGHSRDYFSLQWQKIAKIGRQKSKISQK